MCIVSITELSHNLDEYLERSNREDVFIKKDGRIVSVLTAPAKRGDALEALDSISGRYPYVDYERTLADRENNR